MQLLSLAVSVLSAVSLAAAQVNHSSPLVVETNVGTFRGINTTSGVRAFLGIPFGKSTNGSRRFRPPQRASILPRGTIFNATSYGLSCPQNKGSSYQGFDLVTAGGNGNFSEGDDCLNLNIWAPSVERLNKTSSGAAVLVWIFGGAYTFGSGAVPDYNATNFVKANDDLIVVTLNYRVSMFGFPAGAGDSVSAQDTNPGLYDQRMAVEWVYNNCRAFGCDPERITIFGESAGASSVAAWPYAYEWDPIVKGLIMQSGTETLFGSLAPGNQSVAGSRWNTIANSSGCPLNSTKKAQFECLQNLPFKTLQDAISNASASVTGGFQPQIDNRTVFSQAEYSRRRRAGDFAKLPVLVGNNNDEGTILTALSPGVQPYELGQFGFTCPSALIANSRANASVPAWQYRYLAMWPNLNPFPAFGVFHSSEIPMVFGNYNRTLPGSLNATSEQIATSRVIQGGWAAFARDPQKGLINYGWPSYVKNGTTLIQLGKNNQSTVTFNSSTAYNTGCAALFPELA
ncbi:Alpha/Beta hydrolase protein [Protomyces lactucae-debilis]|uniref:Alpha/Beta hydrolase protein n=1 Tax=Protomyces lactucae-debilis TaxID=2754530 RepID=A0A1Y2F3U8_PROLT|nr:Alpha/Beta hydrolase protein [Protomyces lactucae-debilis]ORY78551.1 Alpha/Beta hydrolase protein [Protomyces lactucae-debilis]